MSFMDTIRAVYDSLLVPYLGTQYVLLTTTCPGFDKHLANCELSQKLRNQLAEIVDAAQRYLIITNVQNKADVLDITFS